jgi:hypothetical protein
MGFLHWLPDNWFSSFEHLTIATGFFLSAYNTRIDWKSRHFMSQLEITKQHKELWDEIRSDPKLSRIEADLGDLDQSPITREETDAVNALIQHLNLVHTAIKLRMYVAPEKIDEDIRQFFSRRVPFAVWNTNRRFQNRDFINFVEQYFVPEPIETKGKN